MANPKPKTYEQVAQAVQNKQIFKDTLKLLQDLKKKDDPIINNLLEKFDALKTPGAKTVENLETELQDISKDLAVLSGKLKTLVTEENMEKMKAKIDAMNSLQTELNGFKVETEELKAEVNLQNKKIALTDETVDAAERKEIREWTVDIKEMTPTEAETLFLKDNKKTIEELDLDKQKQLIWNFMWVGGTNMLAKVTRLIFRKSYVSKDANSKIDMTALNKNIVAYDYSTPQKLHALLKNNPAVVDELSATDKVFIKYIYDDPNSVLGQSIKDKLLTPNSQVFNSETIKLIAERQNTWATGEESQWFTAKASNTLESWRDTTKKFVGDHKKAFIIWWAAIAGLWLAKKIFFSWSKEKTWNKDKKAKSRWSRQWFIMKWIIIGAAAAVGIYGISAILKWIQTGKSPFSLDKWPDSKDSNKKKAILYEKLSPAEKAKYETMMWEMQKQNSSIYNREVKHLNKHGQNSNVKYDVTDLDVQKIDFVDKKWNPEKKSMQDIHNITLFSLDGTFDSVGDMLSHKWLEYQINRWMSLSQFTEFLKNSPKKITSTLLWPFIRWLKSAVPILATGPVNWIEARYKNDPAKRLEELQPFFRSYMMSITYLQDKKIQLKDKLITDKLKAGVTYNETKYTATSLDELAEIDRIELFEDIRADEAWLEAQWITAVVKANFDDKKSFEASQYVNNTAGEKEMSDGLTYRIAMVDETRNEVLWENDSKFDEINMPKNKLDSGDKTLVKEMLWDLEAMTLTNDGTMTDYAAFLTDTLNLEGTSKRDFLISTWLWESGKLFKENIGKFKEKIDNWTFNKTDLKKFKEMSNAIFILQKEVQIAIHTMTDIKDTDHNAWAAATNWFLYQMQKYRGAINPYSDMSKWDRFWYFVWWSVALTVVWGTVMVTWKIIKNTFLKRIPGIKQAGRVMEWTWRVWYQLWKVPLAIWWKAIRPIVKRTWWSQFMYAKDVSRMLKNSKNSKNAARLMDYHIMNWRITKNRLIKSLSEKLKLKGINSREGISSLSQYLQYEKRLSKNEAKIAAKYLHSRNFRQLAMDKSSYNTKLTIKNTWIKWAFKNIGNRYKNIRSSAKNTFAKKLNIKYEFNVTTIKQVAKLDKLATTWDDAIKPFFKSAIKHMNKESLGSLTKFADDPKMLSSIKKFAMKWNVATLGKTFGKYWSKFNSVEDATKFISSAARDGGKLKSLAKSFESTKVATSVSKTAKTAANAKVGQLNLKSWPRQNNLANQIEKELERVRFAKSYPNSQTSVRRIAEYEKDLKAIKKQTWSISQEAEEWIRNIWKKARWLKQKALLFKDLKLGKNSKILASIWVKGKSLILTLKNMWIIKKTAKFSWAVISKIWTAMKVIGKILRVVPK